MSGSETQTLKNLQAAFNGESNANAKYLAFAQAADAEGYLGVGSLFRAAAKAEEFHARNHADVIRRLGGTPQADIHAPAPKSTRENLLAAIEGETYERDVMYPEFIKEAKAVRNTAAQRTFNLALLVEAEHAKLYQDALDQLENLKTARTFNVCTVCGSTVLVLPAAKCEVCGAPKEKFITIS